MLIDRRTLITRAAALTAGGALPASIDPACAAAPLIGRQAPSFYRHKLGSYEITIVSDGARPMPLPAQFVRNVPNERVLAEAEAAYMPPGKIVAPFNPVVVNTGRQLILIDTGYGPDLAPGVGLLPATLAAAGFDPKSFDLVLISHMHGDHILGLKNPDGSPAFPQAEIKVPELDWAHWMSDDAMARARDGFQKASFGFARKIFSDMRERVTFFGWGQEVAPGITAIASPGHTPGHSSFMIQSDGASLFYQGDVTNVPDLFLRHPDWHVMFDSEPELAVATRRRIYDMVSTDRILVSGYHFPFPGLGHVEKAGEGYRLVPASWNPVL